MTEPTTVQFACQKLRHSFVYAPDCPVNLMGRDLLIVSCPMIQCSPDGLLLCFPDGSTYHCSAYTCQEGLFPVFDASVEEQDTPVNPYADIYWAAVSESSHTWLAATEVLAAWKPWFLSLRPYFPPVDPYHCMLYYDRNGDICYEDSFTQIEGSEWDLSLGYMYVGPAGIAYEVALTGEQQLWYRMTDPSDPTVASYAPHITLLVAADHSAKDLGPMVLSCGHACDWSPTTVPILHFPPSLSSYKILYPSVSVSSVLEHNHILSHHGRESSDAEGAAAMLNSLPALLWSSGPTDVGCCSSIPPITFKFQSGPVCLPQYQTSPEGLVWIADTISGLLATGVLHKTDSCAWNTPILPVLKKDMGKSRMVHDLRAINTIITTPQLPVPNSSCFPLPPDTRTYLFHVH